MQEWIIAMLVVSALLILRDMAKTVFSDMKKSAATLVYEQHPQKEKLQRYARSFQRLADSFYGMPYRKDYLSSGEIEDMINQLKAYPCGTCAAYSVCWDQQPIQSFQKLYQILRLIEEMDEEKLMSARSELTDSCISQGKMIQEMLKDLLICFMGT